MLAVGFIAHLVADVESEVWMWMMAVCHPDFLSTAARPATWMKRIRAVAHLEFSATPLVSAKSHLAANFSYFTTPRPRIQTR